MSTSSPSTHRVNTGSKPVWKKLSAESDRAYAVFRKWLDLGRVRKLLDAQDIAEHKHLRMVERWSSDHRWMDRARAYDEASEDQADAAVLEERASLMRLLVRERVSYQRCFHECVGGVPQLLKSIADDDDAPASARVGAMRILIEQSGYSAAEPVEQEEGIEEIMVAELLRCASVLSPEKREAFSSLLNEATVIRAAQRVAEVGDEDL